jgi:hypothetical protein
VEINPTRTVLPTTLHLGVAQVGDQLCMMLRVPDDETGGALDIILDRVQCGELLAQADDVRLRPLAGVL